MSVILKSLRLFIVVAALVLAADEPILGAVSDAEN
jgi:hypothetical protein